MRQFATFSNDLSGAAAGALSTDGGLRALSDNPLRITSQWRWQWTEALAVRAEYVCDNTLGEERSRYGLGLVWNQVLWSALPD